MEKYLNSASMRRSLPTIFGFFDKRKRLRKNQLPKHLRPAPLWPLHLQIVLNIVLICVHITLMWNKDEYVSDVGPAIPMTITLLFLFFVVISAATLRRRFFKGRGAKLAKVNLALTALSFLTWAGTIALFLP